jgi:hypothetical protein
MYQRFEEEYLPFCFPPQGGTSSLIMLIEEAAMEQ